MKARGFFITGTDTGVGKTVVTAGLLGVLRRRGIDAVAVKPVQTGAVVEDGRLISEDARFYRIAANLDCDESGLCSYCLENPLAPAAAAELEGIEINLDLLLQHIQENLDMHDFVLVEGVGGLFVPLIGYHVMVADLALSLGLPLLVVARPGLGTINHTAMTVSCAKAKGLKVSGIIINGYNHKEPGLAERLNPGIIEKITGVPVIGLIPKVTGLSVEEAKPDDLIHVIEKHLDIDFLLGESL